MLNVRVLLAAPLAPQRTMSAILLTMLTLGGGGDGSGHHAGACLGPMPQSGYEASVGCYAGTRRMHRHPAFHGYYYRNAYNYRHYFDYPWQAAMHEPASHFSSNLPTPAAGETIDSPPVLIQPAQALQPLGRTTGSSRSLRR
jgi:hypothetical protein